ncbi:MAG: TetR/AcrR family transcriptional regulator [Sphingomonadaceae bacterium]|nr:TetR/AcrR family transcriptional regulator [Sphingomonadaceae bacterium]
MNDQDVPETTAQRIAMAAMRLFAEKGYGSTSIIDILREAGANSGSLYYAYPTKQDVLLAALRLYRDGIEPMLLAPAWAATEDPIERVFALLAVYRAALEQTDCAYGCPIGSLALELHEPDPPVRALLAENFDAWTAAVEACLEAAADRLPASPDRAALARMVLTVMEGAVMQARTHRGLAAFDESVACLRDYFRRLEAAA